MPLFSVISLITILGGVLGEGGGSDFESSLIVSRCWLKVDITVKRKELLRLIIDYNHSCSIRLYVSDSCGSRSN